MSALAASAASAASAAASALLPTPAIATALVPTEQECNSKFDSTMNAVTSKGQVVPAGKFTQVQVHGTPDCPLWTKSIKVDGAKARAYVLKRDCEPNLVFDPNMPGLLGAEVVAAGFPETAVHRTGDQMWTKSVKGVVHYVLHVSKPKAAAGAVSDCATVFNPEMSAVLGDSIILAGGFAPEQVHRGKDGKMWTTKVNGVKHYVLHDKTRKLSAPSS